MTGYDAIGEFAIGEFDADVDTTIAIPSPAVVAITAPTPGIAAGVTVAAPVANPIALSPTAPSVAAGAAIAVPTANTITLTGVAPAVANGIHVDVPATVIAVTAPTPGIAAGVTLLVRPYAITAFGEGAIGEYAIAESDDVVVAGLRIGTPPPGVAAGVNVVIPVANPIVIAALHGPEIQGRTRSVRVRLLTS